MFFIFLKCIYIIINFLLKSKKSILLNNNLGDIINEPGVVLIESDQPKQDKILEGLTGGTGYQVHRTDLNLGLSLGIGVGGINHGISSIDSAEGVSDWIIYYTRSNQVAHIPHKLVLENHSTQVGSYLRTQLSADKSVPNGTATFTNLLSMSLPAGSWVIESKIRFSANATGYRIANLATDIGEYANVRVPACNGTATDMIFTRLFAPTSNITIYLNVGHNAGSALTVPAAGAYITAMRIA